MRLPLAVPAIVLALGIPIATWAASPSRHKLAAATCTPFVSPVPSEQCGLVIEPMSTGRYTVILKATYAGFHGRPLPRTTRYTFDSTWHPKLHHDTFARIPFIFGATYEFIPQVGQPFFVTFALSASASSYLNYVLTLRAPRPACWTVIEEGSSPWFKYNKVRATHLRAVVSAGQAFSLTDRKALAPAFILNPPEPTYMASPKSPKWS